MDFNAGDIVVETSVNDRRISRIISVDNDEVAHVGITVSDGKIKWKKGSWGTRHMRHAKNGEEHEYLEIVGE